MRFSPRTSKISLLATIKLSYIIKNWFIVHCSLFIVHCSLFIVRCSLFVVHCSLFIVHCSLFIVHCLLFIVYCSLFIVFFLFFCTFNILIAISNFIVTDYFTNIVKCKYLEGYCEHKKLCEINKSSIQISKNLYNIIY